MKMAKTRLSKTQRKAISLGHGTCVNVKNGRIQPTEPEVCSFISTIKNYTTRIQTVKKDYPLTFSSSLAGKRVCNNQLLSLHAQVTNPAVCLHDSCIALYWTTHCRSVLLTFMQLYKSFQTLLLWLSG